MKLANPKQRIPPFQNILPSARKPVLLILFLGLILHGFSQEDQPEIKQTKVKTEKEHSIRKATIYSAVLPGLGQAYNRKYWKIPIVYAGFGVLTYLIVTNTQEFRKFEEAYVYVANDETYPIDNEYVDRYTLNQLESGMNDFRRYRDLSYIITAIWYGLNILDANVDAHFYNFEVSEDLSIRWEPYVKSPAFMPSSGRQTESGVKITLNF